MKKILLISISLLLSFALAACDAGTDNNVENISENTSEPTEVTSPAVSTEAEPVEKENAYVEDNVVNRFITEYNEIAATPIEEITSGNIRTKYFVHINGCYTELINANDAASKYFSITINGGKEETDKETVFDGARQVLKVLHPEASDEDINQFLTDLETKPRTEKVTFKDTTDVRYFSAVTLSSGKTDCRIEIDARNYK